MSQSPPRGGIIQNRGGIVDDVKAAVDRPVERAAIQAVFLSLLEGNTETAHSVSSRCFAGEGGESAKAGARTRNWPRCGRISPARAGVPAHG